MPTTQRLQRAPDPVSDPEGAWAHTEFDPAALRHEALRQRIAQGLQRREQLPIELSPDIVKLFHAVEATKLDASPYVLQFVAATRGAGTSTIVSGFAVAASLEYDSPVLILDCSRSGGDGTSIAESIARSGRTDSAITPVPGIQRLFSARLSGSSKSRIGVDAEDLREILAQLKRRFSVVVLDYAAAAASSDSLALGRYCEGTVLVVRAEHTRRRTVAWALDSIDRFGGTVIGAVLNDHTRHIPPWLYQYL